FMESLQLNAAYRYDHYNLAGDAHTYNLGIEWQPIDDLRFRGGFQRAIRAPNVSELFTSSSGTSANSGRDPCSAASSVTTTAALCIATGVPAGSVFSAGLNCPTNQCQARVGGNPGLNPETSDSWTLGIVVTPTFLPGFTATVDYYNIKIGGFIATVPIGVTLANCYSTTLNPTQSAANPFCALVHRDSLGTIATTDLGFVDANLQNIASDKVQGIDAEVNYDKDLSDFGWTHFGSLSINAAGTLATVNNTSIPGTPTLHCLGVYGPSCGEPQNRFKSHVRLTWTDNKGDFALSLNWRHLSSITFEGNLPSTIAPGFGFTNNPTLGWGAFDYFDLSGTWSVTDAIDLRAGVRNLLDKDPP